MTPFTLTIPHEQRPFSGDDVLAYYDGPLIFWLPFLGRRLLTFALPDDAGHHPFLVLEVTEAQAQAFLTNKLTARRICLEATQAWLMPDYGADVLELAPLVAIPENWLPGDVMLHLNYEGV